MEWLSPRTWRVAPASTRLAAELNTWTDDGEIETCSSKWSTTWPGDCGTAVPEGGFVDSRVAWADAGRARPAMAPTTSAAATLRRSPVGRRRPVAPTVRRAGEAAGT